MLATHLFCSSCIFGSQFASENQFIAVQVVMIFAMMCQVMNITSVCSFMFLEAETGFTMTYEYDQYAMWLTVELVVFTGGIIANVIFLFIRAFIIQKITMSQTNLMHS